MAIEAKKRYISYRCPECITATTGIVGKFALGAGFVRLKCDCEKGSALDICPTNEGKIKLSVPCIFCKENHSYVVSEAMFFDRESFTLACPYSGIDIAFLGSEEFIEAGLIRTDKEIGQILSGFEAEDIKDIQPEEMNEDEMLPDAGVYDTIKFLLRDLEDAGAVSCLCKNGKYDLRFISEGVQAYCEICGAVYDFKCLSPSVAEEYLGMDKLELR